PTKPQVPKAKLIQQVPDLPSFALALLAPKWVFLLFSGRRPPFPAEREQRPDARNNFDCSQSSGVPPSPGAATWEKRSGRQTGHEY
ncbi:hypothetical protein E4U43_006557, partial [Claviceps pusilla]